MKAYANFAMQCLAKTLAGESITLKVVVKGLCKEPLHSFPWAPRREECPYWVVPGRHVRNTQATGSVRSTSASSRVHEDAIDSTVIVITLSTHAGALAQRGVARCTSTA